MNWSQFHIVIFVHHLEKKEVLISKNQGNIFVHVQLDNPIMIEDKMLIILSKLDLEVTSKSCRIALYGKINYVNGYSTSGDESRGENKNLHI